MAFINWLKEFLGKYLYSPKWRCVSCSREIVDQGYFCEDCYKRLPVNDGPFCDHCGRKVKVGRQYCTTCKGRLTAVDKARSAFNYEKPISTLIKKAKYKGDTYLLDVFIDRMVFSYLKSGLDCNCVTFVPMTEKALKKRGYNQSELLAKKVAQRLNLPVLYCLEKTKQTERQAKLSREQRLKNLQDTFKVTDKKQVNEKTVLIVDDVTTTGATAEAIALKLKRAGASSVKLLTVASVPPKERY